MSASENEVSCFPKWNDPYLHELAAALGEAGWHCELVDRRGLCVALVKAALGRGLVHLHWYEALSPTRHWVDGALAWALVPALWIAGRRGRLVWTVHNMIPHEGYAPLIGAPFLRILTRASSRVLVHFDETRQAVERRFGAAGKVFVTPPASFRGVHGAAIDQAQARAVLGAPMESEGMMFVQIGNLRAYKDPATTILAFRDVAPPSARLFIAGVCRTGSIRDAALAAAGDDPRIEIRFGYLSNENLVAALCAADWSICPYRAIDNPGAVNLSVGYDCPVIAPAFAVVRKVTDGHPAILYSTTGDMRAALSAAIALARTRSRSPSAASPMGGLPTSRQQAACTIAHYLAARNGTSHPRRRWKLH
jgi:glycosyltransferase involved in cell wall biosynthesis